jgi:hypothetical protein
VNGIELGPVVGHTDHQSTRIWIKVFDDPRSYKLKVAGVGTFDFVSTEGPPPFEFRTAVAKATGLRPDITYRYGVQRLGRFLGNGRGKVRAMPVPASMAQITFCAISCNVAESDGAWKAFAKFVEDSKPQFILMMGDQLYLDEDGVDVFRTKLNADRKARRNAIVEKYKINWSREVVRKVLANTPVYMMWDDHDIRDGWGSAASDSETLVARHPRGKRIFDKCDAYYQDCRDIYWHFQGAHNPRPSDGVDPALPNYIDGPPASTARYAMPFAFRCGRMVVLMLDSRGDRDGFRDTLPILGTRQWEFIDDVLENLAPEVDALVVMTATPIASIDPGGQTMTLMGDRTDDVDAFKDGDEQNALFPQNGSNLHVLPAVANVHLSRVTDGSALASSISAASRSPISMKRAISGATSSPERSRCACCSAPVARCASNAPPARPAACSSSPVISMSAPVSPSPAPTRPTRRCRSPRRASAPYSSSSRWCIPCSTPRSTWRLASTQSCSRSSPT